MEWSLSQLFEWSLLTGFLLLLIYTMRVIKREKQLFLENPTSYYLKVFHFQTPHWWTATLQEENNLTFQRTDTHYDWKAQFRWLEINKEEHNYSAEELFRQRVSEQNILFDKDVTIIHNPELLRKEFTEQNNDWDIVRVEGTATRNAEERLYYDAYLIKDKTGEGYLYCESTSSVLSGLVEGPYFEEVVKRLKLIDSSSEKTNES